MLRIEFKRAFNGVQNAIRFIPDDFRENNFIFEMTDGIETFRIRWEGLIKEGKAIVISKSGETSEVPDPQIGEQENIIELANPIDSGKGVVVELPNELEEIKEPEIPEQQIANDMVQQEEAVHAKEDIGFPIDQETVTPIKDQVEELGNAIPDGLEDSIVNEDKIRLHGNQETQTDFIERTQEKEIKYETDTPQEEEGDRNELIDFPPIPFFENETTKELQIQAKQNDSNNNEEKLADETEVVERIPGENRNETDEIMQPEEIKGGDTGKDINPLQNGLQTVAVNTDEIQYPKNFLANNEQKARKFKRTMLLVVIAGIAAISVLLYFVLGKKNSAIGAEVYPEQHDTTLVISPIIDPETNPGNTQNGGNNSKEDYLVNSAQIETPVLPSQLSEGNKTGKNIKFTGNTDSINTALKKIKTGDIITEEETGKFVYLTINQVRNDLINKPLCDGLTYTGENQQLVITQTLPDKVYQRKLDLFGLVTVKARLKDELENKSCVIDVFYKKLGNKFDFVNYAEK